MDVAIRESSRRPLFGSGLLVLAAGITTGVLAAAAIVFIQLRWNEDITSYMAWGIIPVASGLCGAAAASGYYFATLYTGIPPTKRLALSIVLLGLATYFLIQFLEYLTITIDGVPLYQKVPFLDYYRLTVTSMQLVSVNHPSSAATSPEPLGTMGYWLEFDRIIGFLVGSFALFLFLSDRPYCVDCNRYYKKRTLLRTSKSHQVDEFLNTCGLTFPAVIDKYASHLRSGKIIAYLVQLYSCPNCDKKLFWFGYVSGRDTVEVARFNYRGYFADPRTHA